MCQDTNQFLELLNPEYNDALKYCRALCARRSADDAEDVLQQSLLKALEKFKGLNDNSKFRSWFFKIITHEFLNLTRKDFWKKFLPMDNVTEVPELPEVYSRIENNETRILLLNALSQISDKERSAILLFEIGGFSLEEIKEMQHEKSISAVKSRLSRSREKLKRLLENEEKNFSKSGKKSSIIIGDLNDETKKLIAQIEGK